MYAHKSILYLHIVTSSPALGTVYEHNITTVTHKPMNDNRCICMYGNPHVGADGIPVLDVPLQSPWL